MLFICMERSCSLLSIVVKWNLVRRLVPEILIDMSVAFFFLDRLYFGGVSEQTNRHPDRLTHSLTDWCFDREKYIKSDNILNMIF